MANNFVQSINDLSTSVESITSEVISSMDTAYNTLNLAVLGIGAVTAIAFIGMELSMGGINLDSKKEVLKEVKVKSMLLIAGLLSGYIIQGVDTLCSDFRSLIEYVTSDDDGSSFYLDNDQLLETMRILEEGSKVLSEENVNRSAQLLEKSLVLNENATTDISTTNETVSTTNIINHNKVSDLAQSEQIYEKGMFDMTMGDIFTIIALTLAALIKFLAVSLLCLLKSVAVFLCPFAFGLSFFKKFEDSYKQWLTGYASVMLTFVVIHIIQFVTASFASVLTDASSDSNMIIVSCLTLISSLMILLAQQITSAFLVNNPSTGSLGSSLGMVTLGASAMVFKGGTYVASRLSGGSGSSTGSGS